MDSKNADDIAEALMGEEDSEDLAEESSSHGSAMSGQEQAAPAQALQVAPVTQALQIPQAPPAIQVAQALQAQAPQAQAPQVPQAQAARVAHAPQAAPPAQPSIPKPAYFNQLSAPQKASYLAFDDTNNIGQAFSVFRMWFLHHGDHAEAKQCEALMLSGIGAGELRKYICDQDVPIDIFFQLMDLIYQPRVAIKRGNVKVITDKFDSVKQFRQRCGDTLLLPDKSYFPEGFLKQFMGGQKIIISGAAVAKIDLPDIPEFDADAMEYWTFYPRITICLPDPSGRKKNVLDRRYLASVINSVYPGAMKALLNEVVRLRLPAPVQTQQQDIPVALSGIMQGLTSNPPGIIPHLGKKGLSYEKPVLPYVAHYATPEGVVFAVTNVPGHIGAVDPKLIPRINALIATLVAPAAPAAPHNPHAPGH